MIVRIILLSTIYSSFAREPPTVMIPGQGTIAGKEISMVRTQRIIGYLGIPYAMPPLGDLRFAPPTETLPEWSGTRNATEYGPACMQSTDDFRKEDLPFFNLISDLSLEINEDCLYLNIFVPHGPPPEGGFATIVWIHPGNFTIGSPTIWNPFTLVYKQGVIVVTFAYRLNIFGFFTTVDGESPGNFGLMDQQAALKWVQGNIKLFGGNPENICLMGYGAGSTSIGIHMISPQSKGLFTKAIAMSGNVLSPNAVRFPQENKEIVDKAAEYFACYRTPTSALIECLRRADATALTKFATNIAWTPIVDQGLSNSSGPPPVILEPPKMTFERGDFFKVPFLTGYTDMEEVLALDSLDQKSADNQNSQEFVTSVLTKFVNKDLPPMNSTTESSCVYNYDLVLDSVLFFYSPQPPTQTLAEGRKVLIDFTTEKIYGSTTYLLASHVSQHQSTYVYRFDMKINTEAALTEIPEWVSVPHLFDLVYVWGVPYWAQLPDLQKWNSADKRNSDIIMQFWTNFAKYSNPTENIVYPIVWDQFTKEMPRILIIDRAFNMTHPNHFNYKAFEFWNTYYPKILELSTQCCNATDNSGSVQMIYPSYFTHFCTIIITFYIIYIYNL